MPLDFGKNTCLSESKIYEEAEKSHYDNETAKGDHRHLGDRQEAYRFTDVETFVSDFLADIERVRGKR